MSLTPVLFPCRKRDGERQKAELGLFKSIWQNSLIKKKNNRTTTKECDAPKMCSEHLAFCELSLKGEQGSTGTGSLFLAGLAPG